MAKKKGDETPVEDASNAGDSESRIYELGFHLDPELPTEEAKKAYTTVRDFIESKGTVVAEGEPEKIQLAYTISRQEVAGRRDFNSAYFSWIAYETTSESHAEILSTVAGTATVIRFIDLLTTREAARHAVEMHEIALKTKAEEPAAEEAEAPAGSDLDTALENVIV